MNGIAKGLLALGALALFGSTIAGAQQKPASMSEADWNEVKTHVDASRVHWMPYKGMGIKKDGRPYRVLDLRTWMGDDYQVVARGILQTQLESAGVRYTLQSAEFDAPAQARMLEDAIATKSYDAVMTQPADRVGFSVPVEKAIAAGIDVYNWVTPIQTPKITAFVGYKTDLMSTNGQIGKFFVEQAQKAGATAEHPYVLLELWGLRSIPLCVERHNGFLMGIGGNPIIKVVELVDTGGQPEALVKAIQDAFTKYPNISGIYPQFGDANAFVEGLRSVGRLAPQGDPKHVAIVLQDIDKAMLARLRDGTFDATVSNEFWHQIDVMLKQFFWHTVLKQPLLEGDALSGKVQLPKTVLLPELFLGPKTINSPKAKLWGGTVAFTDMPLGKWDLWPILDTAEIGVPLPTLADRKRLLDY